ncbi:MAG: tetratricopeptide repeat protein [Planctomycetes bacterium]|nr:tetratricopeptide repeat protein [Planctomycetota bacterium]
MPRIAACLIVRDEALQIERCLASLSQVCDELCVLDTGSTDATRELAHGLGARVERFEWCDDFAAARNASLALTSADWVLIVDADEQLDLAASSPREVRERLESFAELHPLCAGRVRIENRLDDGEVSVADVTRFVRRSSGAAFVGRIHEQWLVRAGDSWVVPQRATTGVGLIHTGYHAAERAAGLKSERNRRLLELELAARPLDAYTHYQLGRTLVSAGRHSQALPALERALELSQESDEWAVHALELGAHALRALRRPRQALELVCEALELVPERTDTRFLAAGLALDCGDVELAEAGLRACLAQGPGPSSTVESSPCCGGWAAAYNLGVICEHSGRPGEAAELYRRALADRPTHRASLEGLARLELALPSRPAIG